jgi:hypothetical protein
MVSKRRVEEDLEIIRAANLSHEKYIYLNKKNKANKKLHLEKTDILAMIIALFSLVLPYVLIYISIMCAILTFMYYFYL